MKLLLILAIAHQLKHRGLRNFHEILPALALAAVPLLMIARQPDFGTAVTLLPVIGVLLYTGGVRVRHLLALVLIAVTPQPVLSFVSSPRMLPSGLSTLKSMTSGAEPIVSFPNST